jgi:hypothetical protein
METVYKLGGVRVIYLHGSDNFEVWKMVSNGPDDFDWDVVLTTDDSEWAVAVADEVWNKMETVV